MHARVAVGCREYHSCPRLLYLLQISRPACLRRSLHSLALYHYHREPGNLVRLLPELSLESTLAPRRLDRVLEARKGGFGGGPNVNWAVSSKSASNALMCHWKTLFNHSTPLGLSIWIPSEDASSGKDRSLCSATSSFPMGRTLL